jgi:hypothetical protein
VKVLTLSTTDSVKYGLGLTVLCGVKAGKTGEDQVLINPYLITGGHKTFSCTTRWQTRVGIYTMNRPEAAECLYALWSRRAVAVPLYDSLIPNAGAPQREIAITPSLICASTGKRKGTLCVREHGSC